MTDTWAESPLNPAVANRQAKASVDAFREFERNGPQRMEMHELAKTQGAETTQEIRVTHPGGEVASRGIAADEALMKATLRTIHGRRLPLDALAESQRQRSESTLAKAESDDPVARALRLIRAYRVSGRSPEEETVALAKADLARATERLQKAVAKVEGSKARATVKTPRRSAAYERIQRRADEGLARLLAKADALEKSAPRRKRASVGPLAKSAVADSLTRVTITEGTDGTMTVSRG
jgi:hypothetical protein